MISQVDGAESSRSNHSRARQILGDPLYFIPAEFPNSTRNISINYVIHTSVFGCWFCRDMTTIIITVYLFAFRSISKTLELEEAHNDIYRINRTN